jgi:hypothetical protein
MTKVLTQDQIHTAANEAGIEFAALRSVIQVECKGSGFDTTGAPVILFERHIFYRQLSAEGKVGIQLKASHERPDLCNQEQGGYGLESAQHGRLQAACSYDRTAALESASWGLGQIMGYQWKALGYSALQDFINAMYKDEAGQLDAMIRFIKVNKLVDYLNNHQWAAFAAKFNGPSYAINHYDTKLADAHKMFA